MRTFKNLSSEDEAKMEECFVIQPFDRGVFDKRYDDVYAPAY